MARRSKAKATGKKHSFGGAWTSTKLDVLAKYLSAYLDALKHQPFRLAYIDAFAGTGYRTMSRDEDTENADNLLFPDLATDEPQLLLDGSARIALKARGSGARSEARRFDRFIFIERDAERCQQLEALKLEPEFVDLAADIRVDRGDANEEIQGICARSWKGARRKDEVDRPLAPLPSRHRC
jgi:three-Cys-motif partner protein